jgi:hypothetical protein
LALDVLGAYEDAFGELGDAAHATDRVIQHYFGKMGWLATDSGQDYEPEFWIALAAAQIEHGAVTLAVRGKALEMIDSKADINAWIALEGSSEDVEERREVLSAFRVQLIQVPTT